MARYIARYIEKIRGYKVTYVLLTDLRAEMRTKEFNHYDVEKVVDKLRAQYSDKVRIIECVLVR